MTKKLRISLSLVYCVAITLLFLPFMKQALIIFRTQTASVQQIETTNQFETVPLEAVQPPDLSDVLAFKEQQNFPAAGRIIIPKVEIALPLFPGLSNEQLLIGAGILFPERRVEDQNVVIVGHHLGRSNLLFGKLMKVKVGDNIYLERQNKLYQYRVSEAKKIQQTELKVLEEGTKAEITLITYVKQLQKTDPELYKKKKQVLLQYLFLILDSFPKEILVEPINVYVDFSFGSLYNQFITENLNFFHLVGAKITTDIASADILLTDSRALGDTYKKECVVWLSPPRPLDWANLGQKIIQKRNEKAKQA